MPRSARRDLRGVGRSGGKPLDQRQGLREAVEAIERGEAEVVVAAYFDRLFARWGHRPRWSSGSRVPEARYLLSTSGLSRTRAPGNGCQQRCSVPLPSTRGGPGRNALALRRPAPSLAGSRRGVTLRPEDRRAADRTFEVDPNTAPLGGRRLMRGGRPGPPWPMFVPSWRRRGSRSATGCRAASAALRVVLGEIHFGKYTPNLNAHPGDS